MESLTVLELAKVENKCWFCCFNEARVIPANTQTNRYCVIRGSMLHFLNADEFNALLLGVGVFQIFIRSFAVLWLCGCFRYIATCMVLVDYCPRSVERSRFGAQGLSLLSHKTWNCKTCSFFFNHFFKSWKTLGFLSTYKSLGDKHYWTNKTKDMSNNYTYPEYFRNIFKKGYVYMICRKFNRWAYVMVSINRSYYATVWVTM